MANGDNLGSINLKDKVYTAEEVDRLISSVTPVMDDAPQEGSDNTVKSNGVWEADKAVADEAAEKLAASEDALKELIEQTVDGMFTYRGSVRSVDDLPWCESNDTSEDSSEGCPKVGDVYNVEEGFFDSERGEIPPGTNWAWNGSSWDPLSGSLADYLSRSEAEDTYATKAALDGKADKVSAPTAGNLAGLDSGGNLTDSGKKASDFATSSQGAKADSAIQGVKVNGTALAPDAGKVVNIPAASVSSQGVVELSNITQPSTSASGVLGAANASAVSLYLLHAPTVDGDGVAHLADHAINRVPESAVAGSPAEWAWYDYSDYEHAMSLPIVGQPVWDAANSEWTLPSTIFGLHSDPLFIVAGTGVDATELGGAQAYVSLGAVWKSAPTVSTDPELDPSNPPGEGSSGSAYVSGYVTVTWTDGFGSSMTTDVWVETQYGDGHWVVSGGAIVVDAVFRINSGDFPVGWMTYVLDPSQAPMSCYFAFGYPPSAGDFLSFDNGNVMNHDLTLYRESAYDVMPLHELRLPSAVSLGGSRFARDLVLDISVPAGSSGIDVTAPDTGAVFISDDPESLELDEGRNVMSFTETSSGVFLVSRKVVEELS